MNEVHISTALKVQVSRATGNCFVATRAIRRGELLLSEDAAACVALPSVAETSGGRAPVQSSVARLAWLVMKRTEADRAMRDGVAELCSNLSMRSDDDIRGVMIEARAVAAALGGAPVDSCAAVVDKLLCNVFTVTDAEMAPIGVGLYLKASKMNHSCCANASQSFTGQQLNIHSIRNIRAGEEVTISYIDVGQPTFVRRHELFGSYHFWCNCVNCVTAESCDGFKCPSQSCAGMCRMEKDASYLKYNLYIKSPLSLQRTRRELVWCHQLPYVYELEDLLISVGPDGKVVPNDTLLKETYFLCDECSRRVSLDEWVTIVNELVSHRSAKLATVSWCRTDVSLLRRHVCDNTYLVMESLNSLVLKLIGAGHFAEASSYNLQALRSFLCLYPKYSIVVAIQYYQQAKLCGFLGETKDALRYVNESINCAGVVCGSTHELYVGAQVYKKNSLC